MGTTLLASLHVCERPREFQLCCTAQHLFVVWITVCFTVCLCIGPDLDEYQGNKNETLTLRDPQRIGSKHHHRIHVLFTSRISRGHVSYRHAGGVRRGESHRQVDGLEVLEALESFNPVDSVVLDEQHPQVGHVPDVLDLGDAVVSKPQGLAPSVLLEILDSREPEALQVERLVEVGRLGMGVVVSIDEITHYSVEERETFGQEDIFSRPSPSTPFSFSFPLSLSFSLSLSLSLPLSLSLCLSTLRTSLSPTLFFQNFRRGRLLSHRIALPLLAGLEDHLPIHCWRSPLSRPNHASLPPP
jgi:hypothetical protein